MENNSTEKRSPIIWEEYFDYPKERLEKIIDWKTHILYRTSYRFNDDWSTTVIPQFILDE